MKIEWTRSFIIVVMLCVAAIIGTSVAGYMYYVQPTIEQYQHAQAQLEAQEQVIGSEQQAEIETSTDLQRKLPIERDFPAFLLQLEQIEEQMNSQIMNLQVTSGNRESSQNQSANHDGTDSMVPANYERATYELNVTTSNFNEMHQYLQRLRNSERMIEINTIQYNQQAENRFDFTIAISTFYSTDLTHLQEEAPEYNFKQPQNKHNPF